MRGNLVNTSLVAVVSELHPMRLLKSKPRALIRLGSGGDYITRSPILLLYRYALIDLQATNHNKQLQQSSIAC